MAASIQTPPLAPLAHERYISLVTYRRTGAEVATPVWFAQVGTTLYVYSDATAGKVKRIHNNQQVRFAACTLRGAVTGPFFDGRARIVTDPREIDIAEAAIGKKYGLTRRLLGLANKLSGLMRRHRPEAGIAYLAITA
ncbi:MAG TPA: PPOX class F420-dependent oxidoreductase [Ktedonobacterales bacterium]|nr:PPOX class F420-dependent oxidoreductase [Ktedonobacterales bacterium]